MRTCTLVLISIALSGGVPTTSAAQSVLTQRIEAQISAVEPRVIAWRRDIHEHPELGNREFRTATLIADHLR